MAGPGLLGILLLGLLGPGGQASKLNVPRVLLPYSASPPHFSLVAESGCYRWSSNRPEVARVEGPGESCSAQAVIQAAAGREGGKASAMVVAEDSTTGLLLRADVIVDRIHELRIVTKTHELYLEETPEKFEVRAYDEQGNEFSTLRGIRFRWSIAGGGAAKTDILRFMSWRASPYNTEPILEELEAAGSQGNKVLLEGVKTGSARVSVRLAESQYSSVPAATEPLLVVANLFLLPPAAHLLPCASLPYSAQQFRGNRLLPVGLPSPHHHLVVPPALGSLAPGSAVLTAGPAPATGRIQLVDQNVEPGEEVKTPSAEVHVVLPSRLELSCLPADSWTVSVGTDVTIVVEIYDVDGNRIHPSDNLDIQLTADEARFETISLLPNGTRLSGRPLRPGTVAVTAALLGAHGCPSASAVTASAFLEVVPALALAPALTLLPWDPVASSVYSLRHSLTGGEAPFAWASSVPGLAAVTQLGLTEVQGSTLGNATVTAAMARAPHCRAEAVVAVEPAAGLELLESEQEVVVGRPLALPLLLSASQARPFAACAALPLAITHSNPAFSAELRAPTDPSHCAAVEVSAEVPSHSKLEVAWVFPSPEGEVSLVASRTVASYAPLAPHSPLSGETVVAEGSSREVAWAGGPLAWPLLPSGHRREVTVGEPGLLRLTPRPHPALHRYSVTCLGRGDTTVTLRVGNTPSPSLPRPVTVESTITISCAVPHSIALLPSVPRPSLPGLPPCPLQAEQGRLAAPVHTDLAIKVVIKDAAGRVIDAIDSVPVKWQLSTDVLGSLAMLDRVLAPEEERDGVLQPGGGQLLSPAGGPGLLDITATIGREGGLLGAASHSDTAEVELVLDARLEPATLAIFELEAGRAEARGGSGYFALLEPEGRVAASLEAGAVLVTPAAPGPASVALADLCLRPRGPGASLAITVSGLASLVLEVTDKVEVGSAVAASVRLLDSSGGALPPSALAHVSLSLEGGAPGLLEVAPGPGPTDFLVTGAALGLASLTARARYGAGRTVASAAAPLTVYPPLVLEPRNISLIIGAAFQFVAVGGPADCTVSWSIADLDTATAGPEGVVTGGSLGATTLTARALGRDGRVYSQDTVEVHVRALSGLRLVLPTQRVLQGSIVPIHLYGQDNDMTVYSYGSASPLLNIDWSVTGAGAARDLESPLAGTGHLMVSDNAGVAMFRAATSGKSTISVTVSVSQAIGRTGQHQLARDRPLTVSASVTVTERLELAGLGLQAGGLLLAPGALHQLQANKAAVYTTASNLVKVTPKGLVTAGQRLGSAVVRAVYLEADREEEVAVTVEVREVAYLAVQGSGLGWAGPGLETLPRGAATGLAVSRHDSWGRQFHGSGAGDLGVRPSRFDLMRVKPGATEGLEARTVAKGWTVVRVEAEGREAWVVARVGDGITGPSALALGDVQRFGSPVAGGRWRAEPGGVLRVEGDSGLAVAEGPGQARLVLSIGEGSVLAKQVTVTRDEGVSVRGEVPVLTTLGRVVVPLVLGGGRTNLLSELLEAEGPEPGKLLACSAVWGGGVEGLAKVWSVSTAWAGDGWSCSFLPTGDPGPAEPRAVVLTVRGVTISLRYLPALQLIQDRVEVGLEDGAEVQVAGHASLLVGLTMKTSDGVVVGAPRLEPGQQAVSLPVRLAGPRLQLGPATITLTSQASGQSVTATLVPVLSSCTAASPGVLSAILASLIAYWQSVLMALVVGLVTLWTTLRLLKPAPAPAPAPATPAPAKQPEEVGGTYLWTQDKSPIYGSPIFRRSPPSAARNLTQYSYN